ncbi:MAG: inositol monophosphatase family protein [Phycisphaerales bacterium]
MAAPVDGVPDAELLRECADAAVHAVSAAAIVTRAVQRHEHRGKIDKADGSPVTIADFAAQSLVIRELTRRLGERAPGLLRVVAEESSAYLRDPAHARERRAALAAAQGVWPDARDDEFLAMIDRGASTLEGADAPKAFWTLDPIDGTKGFIRGQHYCVCLALIARGVPVVGALACPNLSLDPERPLDDIAPDERGVVLIATPNEPVFVRPADDPDSRGRPMERLRRRDDALVFCESWESSHSDQSATRRVMTVLGDRGGGVGGRLIGPPARIDSQCKYAVAARGQADVFLRRPRDPRRRDWIWDHAPGHLIASRMGLRITDAHGVACDFSRGRRLEGNHGVLAALPEVHAEVLGALATLT